MHQMHQNSDWIYQNFFVYKSQFGVNSSLEVEKILKNKFFF